MNDLAGPRAAPLLGWPVNVLRFFRDPIGYIDPWAATDPPLFALCRGMQRGLFRQQAPGAVIALGTEANHALLSQPEVFHGIALEGPKESDAFARLVRGIFGMNGEQHRSQRRLLLPAFHRTYIESAHQTLVELTAQALDAWVPGQTLDVLPALQDLTLRMAASLLFGLAEGRDAVGLACRMRELQLRILSPWWRIPLRVPGTPRARLVSLSERIEAEIRARIADCQRSVDPDARTAIAILLRSRDETGQGLREDELIGHSFALFFAGHETTTSALAWTLLLLSQHPGVLHALRDEVQAVLQGAPPRVDQLGQLRLLDRVIKESMRLLPPVPLLVRAVAKPTRLYGCDLAVGTEVILSVHHTHRQRDLYAQPDHFLPSRWEQPEPSPYAYLPFGAGPRKCLGAALATAELKIILAMLLQRVGFCLPARATVEPQIGIVMAPRQGLPLRLLSPKDPVPQATRPDVLAPLRIAC